MTHMPLHLSEIHDDTPSKRLFAWVVDSVLIAILTAVAIPLTLFIGALFAPLLYAMLSFVYRWVTLSLGSATLGMRLFAVSIRNVDGSPLDPTTAFLHTLGYFVSFVMFPLQLISIACMLVTPRKQGLSDQVLGTAAFNNAARF
ncbi:MAG: RDD family protein [Pseudomonadota bacterium]